MPFCSYCGHELDESAKFCSECGKPVENRSSISGTDARPRTVFEGNVYKCPNCGEIVNAFETKCPACGVEFRGRETSDAVKEFARKLEEIETARERKKTATASRAIIKTNSVSKTDGLKIELIRNFTIPNTKEDILEFMILAKSNMDFSLYNSWDSAGKNQNEGMSALNNAWLAKIRQAYEKARVSFESEPEFQKIQTIYDETNRDIKKEKKSGNRRMICILLGTWGVIFCIIALGFTASCINGRKKAAKEKERLEAIEKTAIDALENGEYKKALLNAETLVYSPIKEYDDWKEISRQWDVKRKLLIDEILSEAEKHGVILEVTSSESEEPTALESVESTQIDTSSTEEISNTEIEEETTEESVESTEKESSSIEEINSAEFGGNSLNLCRLYLDIEYEDNFLFNTYDVAVFFDGTNIGTIKNGKHFTLVTEAFTGDHELTFSKMSDDTVNGTVHFAIGKDSAFSCKIKAKGKKIEISNNSISNLSNEIYIELDNLVGKVLREANQLLSDKGFVNVNYKSDDESTIINTGNWVVVSQNLKPGAAYDKNKEIILVCIKTEDYLNDVFCGLSVSEAIKKTTELGIEEITFKNTDTGSDITDTVKSLSTEGQTVILIDKAKGGSKDLKSVILYVTY